jgi:16S rRNA (cytosine967-C5)-methyltransferase
MDPGTETGAVADLPGQFMRVPPLKEKSSRQAAFEILQRIDKENSYADILVNRELASGVLKGADRGLLTELVFGVLRRRGTLDFIIEAFSDRKTAKLERSVLTLLRLGLYQSLFLDRVPVSAAVNETVKLAKIAAPRASGFINAVLRRADREKDVIPWPDQGCDPAAFISARYSAPRWLVEQWLMQIGPDEAKDLANALTEAPLLTIRTNTLKTSRRSLLERLAKEGIEARETVFSPYGIRISSPGHPVSLPGFQEGLFTVQDESSQLAVCFLQPTPGEAILDICAAPGGKATHIAQLMENRGSVIACDKDIRKLRLVEETAMRLGMTSLQTMILDGSLPLTLFEKRLFDRILIDAPCTGLGVLRRNPEAKWRLARVDLERLPLLQGGILRNSAEKLAPGGVLLYSTCSTSLEENEMVVDDFLSERDDFVIEDLSGVFPAHGELFTGRGFFRSWPHRHGMDGFFAARLRKSGSRPLSAGCK